MDRKIKLAIVDDNEFFRQGLVEIINSVKNLKVVIEVSNGKELIQALKNHKPNVVLLDLKMPVMDGIKTTEYLSKNCADVKILILTVSNDDVVLHDLIEKGANGFLKKGSDMENITDAIYTVMKHKYYFSGHDLKAIVAATQDSDRTSVLDKVNLTKRELEVLKLICRQFTNKEISDKLFISMRTVHGHRNKILRKTKAGNTVGLVTFAIKHGLIKNY